METRTSIVFPPFRLELNSEQLRREDQTIALRPKTFAVLRYLVEHAGKLVTKDELLDAVWAGTVASDTVLKSCIRELREALGDDAQTPRFIATVHRRGYRWVAADAAPVPSSQFRVPSLETQHSVLSTQSSVLVGRDAELTQLHTWLEKALHGERQLVFVTGEAGIGKTTLVDTFLAQLTTMNPNFSSLIPNPQPPTPAVWLGRGQCIEQYGAGEAYMPILEALGRLCRESGGERLIALLHQHAPTWLVQMPALLNATELEALQRKVQGATRERMLREMAEALDTITAERPLILWLEDLHWSDVSTLELLALLARRRETARLLIIGTYRPVDIIVSDHPLKAVKQELQLHGQCAELAVRLLTEEAVAEYIARRFPVGATGRSPLHLAHTIHQRTEGNPLFMIAVVDELLAQEEINNTAVEVSTPVTIRQLIEQQLERLSAEEQHVLEVASVAGIEFSAAAVAAGAEVTVEEVEQRCAALARRGQFLRADGIAEWPNGTITTQYSFLHALYQEVIYARVPSGWGVKLHQRIGECTEAAYGERAKEIAAELAIHFERGQDYSRAVRYLEQAGQNAIRRNAYQEGAVHLTNGLELLKALPDTPERAQQELWLLKTLGPALIFLKGYTAAEVEQTYARAYELCQQGDRPQQLVEILQGLQAFHLVRGEVCKTRDLAEQGLRLAQRVSTPTALMHAHAVLGESLLYLGELTAARKHFEQAWGFYNPQEHNLHVMQHWIDPGVALFLYLAWTSELLGYPDQAQQRLDEGLTLAERLVHPFSLAFALIYACSFHCLHQEWQRARERAEELITLSTEQGFSHWLANGTVARGWALVEQGQVEEGLAQMQQGVGFFRAAGIEMGRVDHLPRLAAAYGRVGRVEEGLAVLAEALTLADNTGMRVNEAELYRLKGELTLQQWKVERQKAKEESEKWKVENQEVKKKRQRAKVPDPQPLTPDPQGEAEACFHKAIEIAQRQQAKSWELRASTSLARLWQRQGKQKQAHKMLAEIYNWFTEGFGTKDLQEAKVLLAELG